MKRILVVRPDRMGDVILSVPVVAAIRRRYPAAQITFLCQEWVHPILKGVDGVHEVLRFAPHQRGLIQVRVLARKLRRRKFDAVVVLQNRFWEISAALFWAGIPMRVGPRGSWHSYLFYTHGMRQRRSRVEKHEADYNLELLAPLDVAAESGPPTRVVISEAIRRETYTWLRSCGWDGHRPLVAVHPGMGGSALNWPEEYYAEIIRTLIHRGHWVLLTFGPGEQGLMDIYRERMRLASNTPNLIVYGGHLSQGVDYLGGLYSWCRMLIAPSTGPLHLAVALGRPVVTFYPPVRVQSARRWGPYPPKQVDATVLSPDVICEAVFHCKESKCPHFPCMESIPVSDVLDRIENKLRETDSTEVWPQK